METFKIGDHVCVKDDFIKGEIVDIKENLAYVEFRTAGGGGCLPFDFSELKFEKANTNINNKLRVWWIPQVGNCDTFYIPVKSVEDGKRLLDTLAAYDAFQLQNKIKPDYCNIGGLQMFDESEGEWNDWYLDTEEDYFDNVDEYCESDSCDQKDELEEFNQELFKQIDWSKMP